MPLNTEQRAAVNTRQGVHNCVSVPGTGKTTVFVARVHDLLEEGVRPQEILGLTFTREGALEMEARARLKRGKNEHRIFRTFHGFTLDLILHERDNFGYQLEHWPLLNPLQAARILVKICHRVDIPKWKELQSYISLQKRKGISAEDAADYAEDERYAEGYAQYEQACKRGGQNGLGVLDFDSTVIEAVKLLETNAAVRARWQFKYVMLDEAQDTDAIQWRLVQLLSQKYGNVFCVGDPNQSMYSWRGSEPDGLLEKFDARFPGANHIHLSKNYRSTKAIVEYCKRIAPSQTDAVKNMCTDNVEGEQPDFRLYGSDLLEADDILRQVEDPENSAVLVRTNRQLRAFEQMCGERNIKYVLLGKSGFFGREEVKNTVAFVQHLFSPTDACVKRILMSPYDCTRFLQKKMVVDRLVEMKDTGYTPTFHAGMQRFSCSDRNQNEYVRQLQSRLLDARRWAASLPPGEAVKQIAMRFGILDHYSSSHTEDNDPEENVLSLARMAANKKSLMEFFQAVMRAYAASRSRKGRLTLSTIHQAKGKEWKNVFVAGVDLDVLPHKNGELEEELRIYFVACSRAAWRLQVSSSGIPSPLIKERVKRYNTGDTGVDIEFQKHWLGMACSQ